VSQTAVALALGGVSFLLTVIWGGPFIRILHLLKVGKQIRIEGPERHITKLGTPTMGGFMVVIPVLIITGILNLVTLLSPIDVLGRSILLPMLVMVAFAVLGAIDDWRGLRGARGQGLRARWKFLWQLVIALGASLVLKYGLGAPELILPSIPEVLSLGVNLTDGLDGLAGLIAATAFVAYGVVAMLQGQVFLMRFCFTVVGALFAFLWYNVHPAELFMGDTGSLSIGATLAVVSLMTGQWALLPVIAIIPASVTASVILQVAYFKLTKGRRLFKMAPLQHHFELLGWSETQVVQRFWLVNLLAAMVGVALALI
jgi:phospho-N-acetylmuramoyl-pentapeptide-transferase